MASFAQNRAPSQAHLASAASAYHGPEPSWLSDVPNPSLAKFSAIAASTMAALILLEPLLATNAEQIAQEQASSPTAGSPANDLRIALGREVFIGAYGGIPYTYNSDVTFKQTDNKLARKQGITDLVVRDVAWDGKPFKSPIYYGIRVASWRNASPFGTMLDFTHGKVYSQPEQVVKLTGIRKGKSLPPEAKIKDIFHHFEFTHGHNMLTLNGLTRLPQPHPRVSPYAGIGVGISLPHTEVQFKGPGPRQRRRKQRTYEYQYTGPVFQALVGFEFRLPKLSYFIEYKFTYARYEVPLSKREGSLLVVDLYNQFMSWWHGRPPREGYAWTTLASHQIIGGMGVRIANPR